MADITASELKTILELSDAIIHEVDPAFIEPYLHPDFPKDRLNEYVQNFSRPSKSAKFIEIALSILNRGNSSSINSFRLLMKVLDSKFVSPFLTSSFKLISEMDLEERAALLSSWRDSPLAPKRRLFRVVASFAISTFVKSATELHNKAIGYIGKENRDTLDPDHPKDDFKYTFLPLPTTEEIFLPEYDVIIIGSGVGAGVIAETLSESNYKSLVLEKGRYFTNEELEFDDASGAVLFQDGGSLPSTDQEIFLIAGSTFGGGSTINWSACLKTPFKVRQEWSDNHGLDFVANQYFDDLLQYGFEKVGASKAHIKHSFSNQTVLSGAKKLGYPHREIEQNIGDHKNHDCGMCHLGCKFGVKQGGVSCWFRNPAKTGSAFMQQVQVLKILHKNGKAYGVLAKNTETNHVFKITGPKKFVVSSGSLNTPIILQKSGFKNKHIGKNLKVHPCSLAFGDFGNIDSAPYNKSIMTSVCSKVEDLDGKYHGVKIETLLKAPYFEAAFFPWTSSDQLRIDLTKYKSLVTILLLDRDTGSGSITYDKKKPDALVFDYSISKFDRNAILEAFLISADILYIEGAVEIFSPQSWTPRFKSKKPKDDRKITDADYVEWRAIVANTPFISYGSAYGSAHQMASCRMSGKGPKDGALDTKGRLYEASNIYVADASIMPTASGANPMITTIALSRHVGLNLVKDLQPQPSL